MPTRRGTAVVAEVGWVNGLAAIRSLGRHGVRVLAVDHRSWALGYRSRYAERTLAPDPATHEKAFVEAVAALAEQAGDDTVPVFPTHDEYLNALARHVEEVPVSLRFPFPSWSDLEAIQSKRHQLDVAESVGVPTPGTRHPRSKEELEEAFDLAASFEPMVQEFIPGGDDELYSLGSYLNREGEPLGLFSGRKLRQTRSSMGTCRVGEAVWVDEVVDEGLRFLRALGF